MALQHSFKGLASSSAVRSLRYKPASEFYSFGLAHVRVPLQRLENGQECSVVAQRSLKLRQVRGNDGFVHQHGVVPLRVISRR